MVTGKNKEGNRIEVIKDRQFLQCKLTEDELAQAAQDLARLIDDQKAVDDEFDTIKSQFKAKLQKIDGDIGFKARLVRDKREIRSVDVEKTLDYTDCTIQVIRLDTGATIEVRKMTGDEKQLKLPLEV